MFAVGLSYMAFIMLRYIPSMPAFWRVFIINEYWILSKTFSAFIEMIIMVFIFQFINIVYHIDWFTNVEESLHPWEKPTWSWCMILLVCYWILFARILLRIFASMFIIDIGLWFWYQDDGRLIEWVWEFLFLSTTLDPWLKLPCLNFIRTPFLGSWSRSQTQAYWMLTPVAHLLCFIPFTKGPYFFGSWSPCTV